MGQKVSNIAYNEEFEDPNISGLSKTQVALVKEYFHSILEECNKKGGKMSAGILANLLNIPKPEAETLIEFVDLDGDGELDEYDFTCMIGLFTQASIEEKLESVFYLFDEDYSQVIQQKELEKLVTCILSINQGTAKLNQQMIKEKIKEIQENLFQTEEPELKMAEFLQLSKEDQDFRNALAKVGVMKESSELDRYLADIELELGKGQEEIRDDNVQYQRRKQGLDQKVGDFDQNAEDGDQFMAVKPFEGVVRNSVPSNFDSKKIDYNAPNANLELEFVHGYRCFDTRNNIFYLDGNNICFHSAGVGVVMDVKSRTQKFNFTNTDDITCIDRHQDLIVTGQIGHKPIINLWNWKTQETLSIITGQLQKGIAQVCISKEGSLLAGSAMNDEHDIAIYDIKNPKQPKLLAYSKGVRDVVLDLKFTLDGKNLIMATAKELYLVSYVQNKIKISKSSGWGNEKQMVLVIGFLQKQDYLVGLDNGTLVQMRGSSVGQKIPAHKKSLYAMTNNLDMSRLFTGGADGKIIVWDQNLKPMNEIIINGEGFISLNPVVRAISYDDQSRKLLIGTRGGEIIDYDTTSKKKQFVIQGHFSFELWGLAMHPSKNQFVTVGEDFLVAKWDIATHTQIQGMKLKFQANCLAISRDGSSIAVGCKNGFILILNYSNLQETKQIRASKQEVTQVKFSKDGKYLAAASRSSQINIYVLPSYKLKSTLKGHHSTVTHLDFSENSNVLMSNCTSYEILFWNLDSGKQDTRGASNNKDEMWNTWTCPLGWPVQGIYPPCSDGTDINSVDRTKDGKICVTGDDFGTVKLFSFPNFKNSAYNKFIGHSSHVTNVRFSYDDSYLISVGGNDKSIFQWKFQYNNQQIQIPDEQYDELNLPEECDEQIQDYGDFQVDEEGGDEAMAVKPYLGNLNASIPSNFKLMKGMEKAPSETLDLHYIMGYRNHDARHMAKLIPDPDKIVFCSAAVGVTMNIPKNTQTFFKEHEEDIISFDLHPSRTIAATGQMAMKGKSKFIDIFVWEVESKKVLAQLNGFHLRAIQLIKFSPDGKCLFTFGKDDDNSLAIYDWQNKRILATQKVDKCNVLDISFSSNSDFLTVGSKHIKQWKQIGSSVKGVQLSWGSNKAEPILCSEAIGNGYVVGTMSGKLYDIKGGIGASIQGHQGKIYVMVYEKNQKKLYTGGEDGAVNVFSTEGGLKLLKKLTQIGNESVEIKIRSLDVMGDRMLIGTAGSELFLMNIQTEKKECILRGHYKDELWGLSVHPTEPIYYTAGDDALVRKWNAKERKHIATVRLEDKARALDCSNKGTHVVVGQYNGEIVLLNSDLKILNKYQSSFNKKHQWIQDIKFSPDGNMVAFGAHGGASPVEVLKIVSDKMTKYAILKPGLTSALLHLDWDVNSSLLVINSQAYELKFVNVIGKQQTNASSIKDVEWNTWTCKIGFPVQGIYPGVDGTDVNTVDRSKNKKILATGDDFQKVKLFKYPCVVPKSEFNEYNGHSSHVTRVKFFYDDQFLVSTGGLDKTSIIWKTSYNKDQEEEIQEEEEEQLFAEVKKQKCKYEEFEEDEVVEENIKEEGGFEIDEAQNDEFMAVKPWLGAIKPPSDFIQSNFDQKKPNIQVQLEYVYGYRARDCRNNIFYHNKCLYYFAAALGIQLNPETNQQQFFSSHTDDIISMDFSSIKGLFATGQLGPKPPVYLWSPDMKEIGVLRGGIIKGVSALKFSPNGSKLACVCIDDNHMVVVFDVDKKEMIACEKGDTAKIVDLDWMGENEFATVGVKHYKTWNLSGSTLTSKKGTFGKQSNILMFGKRNKNVVLCGSSGGDLQVWSGGSCSKSLPINKGTIDGLCVTGSGKIIAGGKEGSIFIFDQNFKKIGEILLQKYLMDANSLDIRSITTNQDETQLFVGLFSSQIYQLECAGNSIEQFGEEIQVKELMNGHWARNKKWTNEIWGLWPLREGKFMSVSDDGTLRMWDRNERKQFKQLELNIDVKGAKLQRDPQTGDLVDSAKLRSIVVCNQEEHIAIGCKEGTVRIVDLKKWKQIRILKKRNRWIQELRYSPDNSKLAIGSHDCFIDIYDVQKNYKILFAMKKHSSFITHLDWSEDSQYLHSNCGAYELLFWNVSTGTQMTSGASALRDEKWASWSCVLGWPVQGIFQPEWDGSDINMVDRSNQPIADGKQVIACADDFSQIRIYKFPCLYRDQGSIILKGHSSHVTNVKFSDDDTYLYSTGGEDQCVMQWRVNYQ